MSNTKRIAVLISGQMRTLDRCLSSIESVIPATAEVFIYAINDQDYYKAKLLKPKAMMVDNEPNLAERPEYFLRFPPGAHGVQRQLRQIYSNYKMWEFYSSVSNPHDWIMRIRSDTIFLTEIEDLSKCAHAIHIPPHGNWFGYNDCFAHGPYEYMKKYYNRWKVLDEYIDAGGIFHTERFLAWVLRDVPVVRSSIWLSLLRANNKLDGPYQSTEWGDPAVAPPERVLLETGVIRTFMR